MKKSILTASILSALAFNAFAAAPNSPILLDQYTNYANKSFVNLSVDSNSANGAYNNLVKRVDVVEVPVTWESPFAGAEANSWMLFVNNEMVKSGTGAGGHAIVPFTSGGLKEIMVRVCNDDGCANSQTDKMVVADSDGSHLKPLSMQADSANTHYVQSVDQVVATYFIEWGIYDQPFVVENIPANSLTHIMYGYVPMCGENKSLKDDSATAWKVLQSNCTESQDYELVIHDMFAALMSNNGTEKVMKLDGKAVSTDELGSGNLGQLMALKQGNPHIKVIPSIGGKTLSDPFYGFTDKANRDTFVASAKEFLKTWKLFDGIDINWQFPGGGGANSLLGDPVNDGPAYVALMQELRIMLDELSTEMGRPYELTSAVGISWDKLQDVDYAQAAKYMDNIFMMPTDFAAQWSTETAHPTALYCGEKVSADKCAGVGEFGPSAQTDKNAADYAPAGRPEYTVENATRLLLEQGVPAKKLVLGTVMQGAAWLSVEVADDAIPTGVTGHALTTGINTDGIPQIGTIDYHEALKYVVANPNAASYWDEQAQGAFMWDSLGKTLIALDTPQSIAARGQFLDAQGLGGMAAWNIDSDGGTTDQRLLNAMNKAVNNIEGDTTPAKQFIVDAGSDLSIETVSGRMVILDGSQSKEALENSNNYSEISSDQPVKWKMSTANAHFIDSTEQLKTTALVYGWSVIAKCGVAPTATPRVHEFQLDINGQVDTIKVAQSPVIIFPDNCVEAIEANAGENIDIFGGSKVLLDGSQSYIFPANPNITYQWTEMKPGGNTPIANAINTDTAVATLTLDDLSIVHDCSDNMELPQPKRYLFQLAMFDEGVAISTDTMELTHYYNIMPSACPTPTSTPTVVPTPIIPTFAPTPHSSHGTPTPIPTPVRPIVTPTPHVSTIPTPTPKPVIVEYISNAGTDYTVGAGYPGTSTMVYLYGSASSVKYTAQGQSYPVPESVNVQWTAIMPGQPNVVISNQLETTVNLSSWMPDSATCPNVQTPRKYEFQLTVGNDTDSVIISHEHIMIPLACGTPTPIPTPVRPTLTPTPVVDFVAGNTTVNNGDMVNYAGSCFVAKNSPGAWETPKVNSWFWDEVACNDNNVQPTPPMITREPTATPIPTITSTPTPLPHVPCKITCQDWQEATIYDIGDEVTLNGITYVAGWWTKGDKPGTTGEWGVWSEVK